MSIKIVSDLQIKNNPALKVVEAARVRGAFQSGTTTECDALDASVTKTGMWFWTTNDSKMWLRQSSSWLEIPVRMPDVINVLGAVIVESPSGVRMMRRLAQQDIDPNFAISGFATSIAATVRRGDHLTQPLLCSASYVSGPPTSVSIADVFGNGAAGTGAWTVGGPSFSAGSRSDTTEGGLSIYADGVDGNPDPYWTATLTALLTGFPNQQAAVTTYWSSDVYWGSTATTDITLGTEVYDPGTGLLVGSFQGSLQRVRNQARSFSGAGRYDWFLWPNEATYTAGTPTFKDQSGFTFGTTDMGTVAIARNGVTRTYKKIRSAGLLSSTFTVTVT